VRIDLRHARYVTRQIASILEARPDLRAAYGAAKGVVRVFRKPAFYEITQRCNLKCEGCYYFERDGFEPVPEQPSLTAWENFFASEAQRVVTMAYFVGAEPALEQERLMAAAPWFRYGNIGTNGTVRIDPAIPFRIGVSVWAGDDETDRKLRQSTAFRKAFRNYAGDPRAIILFTLSPWNLPELRDIAWMCRDHDLTLTFNMYSPTTRFLDKLRAGIGNDGMFFRVSRPGHTPCFSADDLLAARRAVAEVMDEFPDVIVFSRSYNDWATEAGSRYEIDAETGIALHCGSRVTGTLRYHGPNLREMHPKCCTPGIDCSQCRMYSGGLSSRFQPRPSDVANPDAFAQWLETMQALGKIFLYERGDIPDASGAACEKDAAEVVTA
jgi:hypothetical protein